jgi:hypothetical protein
MNIGTLAVGKELPVEKGMRKFTLTCFPIV